METSRIAVPSTHLAIYADARKPLVTERRGTSMGWESIPGISGLAFARITREHIAEGVQH